MSYASFTTDPVYRPSAYSENIMRILEEAEYGGGDVLDCIRTLQQIRPGNMDDWISEWTKIAEKTEAKAEEELKSGHALSARRSLLSAYNYYRHASFHILPLDPRKAAYHKRGDAVFRKAAAMFDPPFEYLTIDFEGKKMEGILYHTRKAGKNPLMVYILGGDATKEEYYYFGVEEANARGLNVLVIDGPGQASSLILHGIKSIPEYEKPVGLFLDALAGRDDIDMDRIAVVGRSFGGFLGPRVTAFEPRVKALVVWGAFYDLYENLQWREKARERYRQIMGTKDETEFWEKTKLYTLRGVAGKIECPLLLIHGEADPQVKVSDAYRLFEEVSSKDKKLVIFKLGEPGSGHCAHDAPSIAFPMVFDWVADKLGSLS